MPIEDLEAKIKAVMAKSKTALAAQPAPAPDSSARAAALAFAAAPPPPVAAAPAPPEPAPAALLDAVFGGDGERLERKPIVITAATSTIAAAVATTGRENTDFRATPSRSALRATRSTTASGG